MNKLKMLVVLVVISFGIGSALAAVPQKLSIDDDAVLAANSSAQTETTVTQDSDTLPEVEWHKPAPFENLKLNIDYAIMSDYIFRGVNMSEYPGEGREDLVHQLTVGLEHPIGEWWGVGGRFFFSWFAGADELYHSGRNIQEIRYTFYFYGDIKQIYSRVMVGMNFFNYPNFPRGKRHDYEWWIQISHNDAWMWKWLWPDNDKGVLNPFLFAAQNMDEAGGGIAGLIGFKHDFAIPGVDALTLTPQLLISADHRLVSDIVTSKPSTKMLFINYGLIATYDISKACELPASVGKITLSGQLNFSQALADYINDEFYGGVHIGWSW